MRESFGSPPEFVMMPDSSGSSMVKVTGYETFASTALKNTSGFGAAEERSQRESLDSDIAASDALGVGSIVVREQGHGE